MLFWCVYVFSNVCDVSMQDNTPLLVEYPCHTLDNLTSWSLSFVQRATCVYMLCFHVLAVK